MTGKPEILSKSKQMVQQRKKKGGEEPAHQRLYQLYKKPYLDPGAEVAAGDKENTFTPAIHSKSRSIVRSEKVEEILYKDAKRRNEQLDLKQKQKLKEIAQKQSFVSLRSEQILAEKFLKELNQILSDLFSIPPPADALEPVKELVIDLASVFEIMIKMGFIRYNAATLENPVQENEKRLVFLMWNLLGGERFAGVLKTNLVQFLLAVLNIDLLKLERENNRSRSRSKSPHSTQRKHRYNNHSEIIQPRSNEKSAQPLDKNYSFQAQDASAPDQQSILLGSFTDDGYWAINDGDKNCIHNAFAVFYRNRLNQEELSTTTSSQQASKVLADRSVSPILSRNSQKMADQYR